MRRDTYHIIIPVVVVGLVLFGATRIHASREVVRYVDELYKPRLLDTEYWDILKSQAQADTKEYENKEKVRVVGIADKIVAEIKEQARQEELARQQAAREESDRRARILAQKKAQEIAAQEAVQKAKKKKKKSRKSKAS